MKALLILLGILKWLGIILLALLILILLIVLVVMLSPIRYRLAGEKKEALCGSFSVFWLFGTVKADGTYTPEENLKLKVKVLWMTLVGGEEKPKKKKPKKAKQQAPKTEKVKPDIQTAEKKEAPKQEPPKEKPQEEKAKIRQQRMD
ncbi:MAG: hypothetical protein IKY38_01870, partial [Anaerotignum sp.]|nr:hypothetical protein [Anaerotignum sp.]